MKTFQVIRNGLHIADVKAVSMRQALITAKRRHGRVELIGTIAKAESTAQWADYSRTEGRAPCNRSAEAKARIEAIRKAEIARYLSA